MQRIRKKNIVLFTCNGLGGAGLGGGCFFWIFGGKAGDGDSGLAGGFVFADKFDPELIIWLADVGACSMANGSLPKSSLFDWKEIKDIEIKTHLIHFQVS